MRNTIFIPKQFLIREYVKNKKSQVQVAEEFGCSVGPVWKKLSEYNIPRRTISEAKLKFNITKEFLIREYSENERTPQEIADEIGCCYGTIYKRLKSYDIPMRTISEANKRRGKNSSGYIDGRRSKTYYCIDCLKKGIKTEIAVGTALYGGKRCSSCAAKNCWKNKEWRDKIVSASAKGRKVRPNNPEKELNKLLQQILPNTYEYVGDGKVILGGFCPDFANINGQKHLIELFGDYWHNREDIKKRDKSRIEAYNKLGYKILVVWQYELKNIDKLKTKILKFDKKIG